MTKGNTLQKDLDAFLLELEDYAFSPNNRALGVSNRARISYFREHPDIDDIQRGLLDHFVLAAEVAICMVDNTEMKEKFVENTEDHLLQCVINDCFYHGMPKERREVILKFLNPENTNYRHLSNVAMRTAITYLDDDINGEFGLDLRREQIGYMRFLIENVDHECQGLRQLYKYIMSTIPSRKLGVRNVQALRAIFDERANGLVGLLINAVREERFDDAVDIVAELDKFDR